MSTVQHSAVQYSAAQYRTAQLNTSTSTGTGTGTNTSINAGISIIAGVGAVTGASSIPAVPAQHEHNAVQYSKVPYLTAEHSATQHSAAQRKQCLFASAVQVCYEYCANTMLVTSTAVPAMHKLCQYNARLVYPTRCICNKVCRSHQLVQVDKPDFANFAAQCPMAEYISI